MLRDCPNYSMKLDQHEKRLKKPSKFLVMHIHSPTKVIKVQSWQHRNMTLCAENE